MACCPKCGKAKLRRDKAGRRKCQRCGCLSGIKRMFDRGGNFVAEAVDADDARNVIPQSA